MPLVLAAAGAAIAVVVVVSIGVGSVWLTPAQVIGAMVGAPESPAHEHIVVGLRMPRALIAATAGAMLALSGAVVQAASRNDLADPSLLGVTSGASLAVVATLSLTGAAAVAAPWSILIAFVGALAAAAAIWALGWRSGASAPRLVLDGVLLSAVLSSLVSVLLIFDGALFGAVLRWVIGSLNGRVWADWAMLWPFALVIIPAALLLGRMLRGLWMGDAVAGATGIRPVGARAIAFVIAAALAGGAVSVVGAIGFIGLIAPHLARRLVGADPVRVLPLAALLGALLLLGADLAAELLSALISIEEIGNRARLPAGAVTAVIGGPALFLLLIRKGFR